MKVCFLHNNFPKHTRLQRLFSPLNSNSAGISYVVPGGIGSLHQTSIIVLPSSLISSFLMLSTMSQSILSICPKLNKHKLFTNVIDGKIKSGISTEQNKGEIHYNQNGPEQIFKSLSR